MKHEEVKQRVLDYITRNSGTTYAEIERVFNMNGYPFKGNLLSCSNRCENVVLWSGWTKDAFLIISDLLESGLIHREPCRTLLYMIDGKALTFPVVKRFMQYKTPHWLPTVFIAGPER